MLIFEVASLTILCDPVKMLRVTPIIGRPVVNYTLIGASAAYCLEYFHAMIAGMIDTSMRAHYIQWHLGKQSYSKLLQYMDEFNYTVYMCSHSHTHARLVVVSMHYVSSGCMPAGRGCRSAGGFGIVFNCS